MTFDSAAAVLELWGIQSINILSKNNRFLTSFHTIMPQLKKEANDCSWLLLKRPRQYINCITMFVTFRSGQTNDNT